MFRHRTCLLFGLQNQNWLTAYHCLPKAKGLLEADDDDDLRVKLISLKEVWNSNEQFDEYINEKVDSVY